MTNVLLIEDDADLASMLSDSLEPEAYRIWHVTTAAQAELVLDQMLPDLILLDLMLPDRNGLVLCASLNERLGVPILVCSATRRKDDAALAFRLGAADFLAKPFSLDDLQARMQSALNQAGPSLQPAAPKTSRVQQIDNLRIDRAECRVSLDGHVLDLTPTEYRLLCAVAARPNHVLSRKELADATWGTHDLGIMRSLGVHMRRLRAKLEAAGVPAPRVTTRRGFGYALVDESGRQRGRQSVSV
jgi:DNA-binding response OmpR family regulator